jgi:hypothetical protein
MTATTVLDILPRRPRPIAALERYQGLSASAGTRIAGWEHLRQSVLDILTTYPGERSGQPHLPGFRWLQPDCALPGQ